MKESKAVSMNGGLALLLWLGSWAFALFTFANASRQPVAELGALGLAALLFLFGVVLVKGLVVVQPNEARVLQFLGSYAGTVKDAGLRWVNPFTSKTAISLRARNFETPVVKVNDIDGNPVEVAAVIVWRVADTARAMFDIQDYPAFVQKQCEAAIRNLAAHYPYDAHQPGQVSLRGSMEEVAAHLEKEINARIAQAGVEITDARIAHLAYAPEIAQAMLQRQQAGAIIAARTQIVEGAVSMVEMALQQLSLRGIVELDAERKATMVSNLLVVLCGERGAQPVINSGSLY
jgi:regulator of protease activity HflC (stomatin/prohibitin superfamily)